MNRFPPKSRGVGYGIIILTCVICLYATARVRAGAQTLTNGADISMLSEIERAGGVFRDENGTPGDEISILRAHGCQLFRVRLFVDPDPNYSKTDGATQDLSTVRALGKRIKAAGGQFMLDIHYSDTWADPGHQIKPKAWEGLDFDALEKRVGQYTSDVLKDLIGSGAAPDMVQVGNEITAGMIWPDGNVLNVPAEKEQLQWKQFARLFNAGAKAVRAASSASSAHPMRIILHIHGGGREGLPKWFFGKFDTAGSDFDIIGLSFYPAWGDSIDALKQNLSDVIGTYGKDVLIAETSYPWRPLPDIKAGPPMLWPQSPQGQEKFVRDLSAVIRAAPGGHGLGFMWWYSDAIQVPTKMRIWRTGSEALFDSDGKALPALGAFGANQ
jgi:arabinogalactan endo-1,4-beta-galactosidase